LIKLRFCNGGARGALRSGVVFLHLALFLAIWREFHTSRIFFYLYSIIVVLADFQQEDLIFWMISISFSMIGISFFFFFCLITISCDMAMHRPFERAT